MSVDTTDLGMITEQLGCEPRDVVDIFYRSPDGTPGVTKTKPCLDDGTPFLTLFYLTDPRPTTEASRLGTTGVIREMTARLGNDTEFAADYQRVHETFLTERNEMEDLGTGFSGGGMPTYVKCLYVFVACTLVKGPDHFRLGIESVVLMAENEKLRGTAVSTNRPTVTELGTVYSRVGGQ